MKTFQPTSEAGKAALEYLYAEQKRMVDKYVATRNTEIHFCMDPRAPLVGALERFLFKEHMDECGAQHVPSGYEGVLREVIRLKELEDSLKVNIQ